MLKTSPNLPFLLVGYADMTIGLINGKLRPMPLFSLSLKNGPGKKIPLKEESEDIEVKPIKRSKSEKMLDYGSSEEEEEVDYVDDLFPVEEAGEKSEEKPFEVNKDLL